MLRRRLVAILINRNHALFVTGAFITAIGFWFLAVAVGWLVWEIGRSEFLLGVANFAQMGPLLLLGLFGGVMADRMDRRRLLLVCQIAVAIATAGLALAVATGVLSIPLVLALLLVVGITQAFSWPTWSPFIADLVGAEHLRAALALNSARFNLTRIFGPALAGVLLAQVGAAACLAIAAVTQLGLLFALLAIRVAPRRATVSAPWLVAIREGVHYAWFTPAVRELMILAGIMGTVVLPYIVFLPAYAQNVLGIGAPGLGLLFTSVGVGAILGAAASGTRAVAVHPRRAQGVFTVLAGVFLAVFALSTIPLLSAAALVVVGFGAIGFLATANATVQLAVPKSVAGRVIGIWVVLNAGMTPVGGLLLGAIAERASLPVTLAVAGLLCAVLSGAIVLRSAKRAAGVVDVKRERRSAE